MKSRRVILTIEVETDLSLADLRQVVCVTIARGQPLGTYRSIYHPKCYAPSANDKDKVLQVQANAIRPEPKPKGMVYVSVRPSSMEPVHTGNTTPGPADLIDTTQDGPHPAVSGGKRIRTMKATHIPRGKAKRAKGAK